MFKRLHKWWTRRQVLKQFKRVLLKSGKVDEQFIKENSEGLDRVVRKWLDHL